MLVAAGKISVFLFPFIRNHNSPHILRRDAMPRSSHIVYMLDDALITLVQKGAENRN